MFKKIILFYLLILLSSCGKDMVFIEGPISTTETDEIFEVNLIGFTTDENRNYLSGSEVTIEGKTITSDESGFFHIEKVLVGQKGKVIQVKKEGYIPAIYRVAHHQSLEQIVLNLQLEKVNEKTTIDVSGGSVLDENGKVTLGGDDLNMSTEFTFQSYVGVDANKGNEDQLILDLEPLFLLKEASFYIDGSSPLNDNSKLDVELNMDNFNSASISSLAIYYFDEMELTWKEKNISLSNFGDKLFFKIDAYGWWTIGVRRTAQYGTLRLIQPGDWRIINAEVNLSYQSDEYRGSTFYTNSQGTISTYFPREVSITASLSNKKFQGEFESNFTNVPSVLELTFGEEVQLPIVGQVYACDFTFSDGFVAIVSDGQHKIKQIEDGFFIAEAFINDEDVSLQFYSSDFEWQNSKSTDIETLTSGTNSFFSCANLNDNLVVSDGTSLLQDFDRCRVKVRPNETVVIGERSNGDVFLVSFDGKSEGVYDGLFYFPDEKLDDVKAEVVVNIILYDEIENKVGGFIKTEYISTGEELRISFIGNIE